MSTLKRVVRLLSSRFRSVYYTYEDTEAPYVVDGYVVRGYVKRTP